MKKKLTGVNARTSHYFHSFLVLTLILCFTFMLTDMAEGCSARGDNDEARYSDIKDIKRQLTEIKLELNQIEKLVSPDKNGS